MSPRGPRRLALPILAGAAAVALVWLAGRWHPPGPPTLTFRLEPGTSTEREIGGGESHLFTVRLPPGVFVEAVVEQRGVDVKLVLVDTTGEDRLQVDSPNTTHGIERALFLVEVGGDYRLEIRTDLDDPHGVYSLRVDQRPAADAERARARAAATYDRADRLRRQKTRDEALSTFNAALADWRRGGDLYGEALTLHRIGQIQRDLRRFPEALEAFVRGADLYNAWGGVREEAVLRYQLGKLYYDQARYGEAFRAYDKALAGFEQAGDLSAQASALNGLGLTHDALGETQETMRYYQQALAQWQELRETAREATTLNNLGELYLSLAEHQVALDTFQKTLELRRAAGDRLMEAVTLTSLGTAYRRLDDLPAARASFEEALAVFREAGDKERAAIALVGLGATYFKQGELEAAREAYEEALELARSAGDRSTEAYALAHLGWLAEERGAPGEGLGYYREALPIFRELADRTAEASTLHGIAHCHRALGELEEAREAMELALERVEDFRAGTHNQALRESYFAFRRDYFEVYVDLLMELHQQEPGAGYAAQALAASERGRARSFLEMLQEGQVDLGDGVDPALPAREREVAARLGHLELQRTSAGTGEERDDLQREIRALAMQYQGIQSEIREQHPRYAAIVKPEVVTANDIQQDLLDADTLLLEYSLGEERSFLWVVDRDGLESYVLPGRGLLEPLARQVHRLTAVSHHSTSKARDAASLEILSRELLGPVAQRLGYKRLAIVPDGALHYVPFAALPSPGGDTPDRPLIADHEIVILPSATVLRTARRQAAQREPPAGLLAVVGAPVFHPTDPRVSPEARATWAEEADPDQSPSTELPPLPGSLEEALAILEMADEGDRLAALGFDANLERVTGGDLAGYRILHFATHGRIHAEQPELSGLFLSLLTREGHPRPGVLWAYELYRLELPADLVVLSACRTALGAEVRGEGMVGLTRGFMHAGATRVVVSLWPVSDPVTRELMVRFYQGMLEEGLPAAAALRRAQIALWQSDTWSAPYYWAAFVLQGDWS